MKYLGTISNSQDIITKGWLIKNVASVIPDGSITASKLAENIETSIMVASEIKNPPLTKSGDTFIWTISATEHGLMSTALSVIVYDTNGKQVACDISVGNDYGITISIYDNSTATSVSAETYRAVIIGNGSPKTSDVSELVITELDKKQILNTYYRYNNMYLVKASSFKLLAFIFLSHLTFYIFYDII